MPEPKNIAADIAVRIKSQFDPQGTDATNKAIDAVNQKAVASTTAAASSMQAASQAAATAERGIFARIGNVFTRLTQTFGNVARAAQAAIAGLGIIGVINSLISAVQMLKEQWEKFTTAAVDAGQSMRDTWALTKKEMEGKAKQDAVLESLKAQKKYHDDILATMRAQAEFAAQLRELEARRQGDEFGAQRAALEGALARGDISKADYTRQTRSLEDQQRAAGNERELAPLLQAVAETAAAQEAARKEQAKSSADLQDLLRQLASYSGENNPEAFARAIQEAAASIVSDRQTIDENASAWKYLPKRLEALQQGIAQNKAMLESAAATFGVTTQKADAEGNIVAKTEQELADEITAAAAKMREGLATAANEAVQRERAASQAAAQAAEKLAKTQEVQAAEAATVAKNRAEADNTAAHAATQKAEADAKAANEQQAATEREMLARDLADRREEADKAQTAAQERATAAAQALSTWWEQNKDRLAEDAERSGNKGSVDALDAAVKAVGQGTDASAVSTLASMVEHMANAEHALACLAAGLQQASMALETATDTANTAEEADRAAQMVAATITQQNANEAARDQVISSTMDTLEQLSAASPGDAQLEGLQAMARAPWRTRR